MGIAAVFDHAADANGRVPGVEPARKALQASLDEIFPSLDAEEFREVPVDESITQFVLDREGKVRLVFSASNYGDGWVVGGYRSCSGFAEKFARPG